jgi:hypothetical protein
VGLNQPADQLFFQLFLLILAELVFQALADARLQLVEGGALTVVFGKFVVEHRQNFLFDLTRDNGKIHRFAGNLFVRIIFWVIHRDRLPLA